MARKQRIKDDTPEGGWLGPPPTEGLKPLAIAVPGKKGKWKWKPVKQTARDKKLRKKWEKRMAKADKKGNWRFKWPPKE